MTRAWCRLLGLLLVLQLGVEAAAPLVVTPSWVGRVAAWTAATGGCRIIPVDRPGADAWLAADGHPVDIAAALARGSGGRWLDLPTGKVLDTILPPDPSEAKRRATADYATALDFLRSLSPAQTSRLLDSRPCPIEQFGDRQIAMLKEALQKRAGHFYVTPEQAGGGWAVRIRLQPILHFVRDGRPLGDSAFLRPVWNAPGYDLAAFCVADPAAELRTWGLADLAAVTHQPVWMAGGHPGVPADSPPPIGGDAHTAATELVVPDLLDVPTPTQWTLRELAQKVLLTDGYHIVVDAKATSWRLIVGPGKISHRDLVKAAEIAYGLTDRLVGQTLFLAPAPAMDEQLLADWYAGRALQTEVDALLRAMALRCTYEGIVLPWQWFGTSVTLSYDACGGDLKRFLEDVWAAESGTATIRTIDATRSPLSKTTAAYYYKCVGAGAVDSEARARAAERLTGADIICDVGCTLSRVRYAPLRSGRQLIQQMAHLARVEPPDLLGVEDEYALDLFPNWRINP